MAGVEPTPASRSSRSTSAPLRRRDLRLPQPRPSTTGSSSSPGRAQAVRRARGRDRGSARTSPRRPAARARPTLPLGEGASGTSRISSRRPRRPLDGMTRRRRLRERRRLRTSLPSCCGGSAPRCTRSTPRPTAEHQRRVRGPAPRGRGRRGRPRWAPTPGVAHDGDADRALFADAERRRDRRRPGAGGVRGRDARAGRRCRTTRSSRP